MSFFEFPHTRTYDNDLGWLIKNVKKSEDAIRALEQWKSDTESSFEELQELLYNISIGNIPKEIADAITAWFVKNFNDILGKIAKTVWFGLTDTGYFVAYIPESWKSVVFKTTGLDIETELQSEYGHLVLQANYYTHSL